MLRASEFAFGLEKQWRERRQRVQQVPWYLCFLTLAAGIWAGDTWGPEKALSEASLTSFWGVGGLFFLLLLLLACLICQMIWHRQQEVSPRRTLAIFAITWGCLWFVSGMFLGCPKKVQLPPTGVFCEIQAEIIQISPGVRQMSAKIHRWQCENEHGNETVKVRIPMNEAEMRLGEHALFSGMHFETRGWFEPYEKPDVPGMFDAKAWAKTEHLQGSFRRQGEKQSDGYVYDDLNIYHVESGLLTTLENWRRKAYEQLSSVSSEGILTALVLGVSRDISQETRLSFGRLGIAHVLAVSGLHFGLIAMGLNWIFIQLLGRIPFVMRRWGKKRAAAAIVLPGLALYLLFVGAPISAQRAWLMVAISTLAVLCGRKPERARALSMAGMLILVFDPMAIFAISFQLSFSAVLGILWGSDFYEYELKRRIESMVPSGMLQNGICAFVSALVITLSTSVTTAPFVMWHFGQLPILGIVTNLIVIPYVSFILMPLAIAAALVLSFELPFANFILKFAGLGESVLVKFAQVADARIPLNCIDIAPHIAGTILAIVTAVLSLYRLRMHKKRILVALVAILSMATYLVLSQTHPRLWTAPDMLRITFVSMGQADATLLEFPNGHVMLIDAGSELGRIQNHTQVRLVPYLRQQGIRHINTLVLTHSDYDHVAGLQALAEQCTLGQIWYNGYAPEHDPEFWQKTMPKQMTNMFEVAQLQTNHQVGDAKIEILWPRADSMTMLQSENQLNANEMSIVLRLQYGQFTALFMGDAGEAAERHMIEDQKISPVTLLKVGHHGSKSSSSTKWIEATKPALAIFSVGKRNRYKFPHADVQRRFHKEQTQMYRTDRHGTVQLTTDGNAYRIQTTHAWI